MSIKRKLVFAAVILTAFLINTHIVYAGNSNAGTAAYSFLKIGTGAKSQALGGAFVGLADDETALYYNPGGLTAKAEAIEIYDDLLDKPVEEPEVKNRFTATYINYLLDFQYGFLGYTRELDDRSAAGISISYQNYGTFNRLNVDGDNMGTFGASDIAIGMTYSKRLQPRFSAGATGKFIYEKIDDYSSNGLALDLGIMYLLHEEGSSRLGVALTNLGAQLSGLTETHKDPLPTKLAVGLSHRLRGLPFLFSSEAGKPFDNDFYIALGAELVSLKPLFVRVGWSSTGKDYRTGDDSDTLAGFAGGFGYNYDKYTIDYSYASYVDLGSVHRISLGAGF
jgi:hypothetical protein